MLKVGLTGGIGSGKTTTSKIFMSLGVPVFNADLRAREIVNTSEKIANQIKESFGTSIYTDRGELDRKRMASLVFQDNEKLKLLNSIIHPAVANDYKNWIELNRASKYSIKEVAILFETGGYVDMDKTIVVSAPEEIRIKRVVQRDNSSEKDIRDRISKQWPDEKKIEMADFIIYNNEKEMIIPQVMQIHEKLLKL